MIDFVSNKLVVIVLRDNRVLYDFVREEILEKEGSFLIALLNYEAKYLQQDPLTPTEEDQFLKLREYLKES